MCIIKSKLKGVYLMQNMAKTKPENLKAKVIISVVTLIFGFLFVFPTRGLSAAYIGESTAKSVALDHAGFSEADVTFIKLARYDKHRTELYDVEFLTDSAKYSYEINAVTGEVIASYYQAREKAKESGGAINGVGSNNDYIGSQKAESIAFAHAGIPKSEVRKFDIKLKEHKGRAIYEVEFVHKNTEYEYEIDAVTGDILEWESDYN
jgi:uncharacterized membrane protein YkoI